MKIKKKKLQIAIDGPIGVGKSSLAFLLAQRLNLIYIHTGAMYRTVTYAVLENKIPLDDKRGIIALVEKSRIELKKPSKPDRYTDVYLDGQNIAQKLFTRSVTNTVAHISKIKKVRQYLVKIQQQMAKNKAVVMEGRDIGTKVLPKANIKIFLTADLKIRARRRWAQLKKINKPQPFFKILEELKKRDELDMNRKESPLKKATDAWTLDTTTLTIPGTVEVVLNKLKEKGLIE